MLLRQLLCQRILTDWGGVAPAAGNGELGRLASLVLNWPCSGLVYQSTNSEAFASCLSV